MSWTLFGWLVAISFVTIGLLLVFRQLSNGTRMTKPVETLHGKTTVSAVTLSVFVLVAGFGTAMSVLNDAPEDITAQQARSDSSSPAGPDSPMLARLKDYTRSINSKQQSTKPVTRQPLPDVNTMIEQLAARLKTTPDDADGWRMLGWSYFNTARFRQAVTAYARAVELSPDSADLKRAYKIAKAKAADTNHAASVTSGQTVTDKSRGSRTAESNPKPKTGPSQPHNPAIRSMVDGLAERLTRAPRDVAGWTRLMRSRVVLGEKDVAITALQTALDVFKDDSAASSQLAAAARDLGLKSN